MIGIRFKIKNEYSNIFYKIFKNINFKNYRWDIVEDEIYCSGGKNYFHTNSYMNSKFQKLIEGGVYYPVFANIQVYLNKNKLENINNYQDFVDSNCELILLITDNEFVDIYAKNEEWLNIIYQNAIDNNFKNIKYIRDNDSSIRYNFSAYSN